MSFPTFKFKELIEEEWETSVFGTYLSETRFFFVVYKFDENDVLRLKGCQFWNIPYADLENEVKKVWNKTKQVIIDGLFILNYLEGNVKLSKLLDAFQKSRGVPMIKKSDYSVVTDKIVINVDIESR